MKFIVTLEFKINLLYSYICCWDDLELTLEQPSGILAIHSFSLITLYRWFKWALSPFVVISRFWYKLFVASTITIFRIYEYPNVRANVTNNKNSYSAFRAVSGGLWRCSTVCYHHRFKLALRKSNRHRGSSYNQNQLELAAPIKHPTKGTEITVVFEDWSISHCNFAIADRNLQSCREVSRTWWLLSIKITHACSLSFRLKRDSGISVFIVAF